MSRIHEPVTTFTDYGLAALAAVLAAKMAAAEQAAALIWAAAFAASALAAALGGTSHGFGPGLQPRAGATIWRAALMSVIAAGTLVLAASATACLPGDFRFALIAATAGKSIAAAVWTWRQPLFGRAVVSYAFDLVVVLVLHIYRWDLPGSGWIAAAIAVSAVAAAVQASHVALHRHFNHNDLFHVLQAAGLYLLYRGASLLVLSN